jgi:3-oxoacyl-[acyl-carrier-protein] synthase II
MSRVVVTGLGATSPYGAGVAAYWKGLSGGVGAIRDLTLIETDGFRCRIGAEVSGPLAGSGRRTRADRLAIGAAAEALEDAGLGARDRRATALVVGAVGGGMLEAEAWYWRTARGPAPTSLRAVLPCAHAESLASRFRLGGPRHTVVTACSSGAVAVAEAAELIADGVVDVALAGGVDAITRICFMGFNALKLLDPTPCRPFDRERRGMSIGEGAAFMVLESETRARARRARVYATLAGHGLTTDAFHVTAPDPDGDGMVRAMRAALAQAGAAPAEVQYANAHGTGTPQNDRIEARALARVFGEGGLLVSSSKSMIGHTMAAAGSLEAIATVLALDHGVVPPTANLTTPDPDVAFDCVPHVARPAQLTCAISNSFGFGGQNVTLLFRRGVA